MRYGKVFGCKPFCFACARMAFEELSHTRNKAFYRFRIRGGDIGNQDRERRHRRFKGTKVCWSSRV